MKKLLAALLILSASFVFAEDLDVVAPANLTKKPSPEKTVAPTGYPKGVEALVLLEIVISKEGKVIDVKVKKSNNPDCEPSAMEAIRQWVFTPGEKDGAKVATRVTVPFRFNNE